MPASFVKVPTISLRFSRFTYLPVSHRIALEIFEQLFDAFTLKKACLISLSYFIYWPDFVKSSMNK
jgi:hypothetical protein